MGEELTPAGRRVPASRSMRRYIRNLAALVALALLASCLTNLVVNPWRVTPGPLSAEGFEAYRDFSSQNRTGKCGYIRSAPSISAALIGSSRVTNSLDPLNPNWGRDDVYNLGCNACYIYESEAFFRYLTDRHTPATVILGIDPGDLSSDFDTRSIFDFQGSPLGPEKGRIDREIRYLVGISTLEGSFETIKRKLSDETPQYDSRGLRRHRPRPGISQRAFLERALRGESQFEVPQSARDNASLKPDKRALLESVVETSLERGIRLILLIHPQHALSHARDGGPPFLPYERERREITEAVDAINRLYPGAVPAEVWDFGDFHPINCEQLPAGDEGRMNRWDDFNHYTLEIGDLMLARIMGWPIESEGGSDYGMRLTPANFDEWSARAREGYRRYTSGPGKTDIDWAQSMTRGESD